MIKRSKSHTSKSFKASDRIKKRNDVRKNVTRGLKVLVILIVLIAPVFVLRADFLQIKDIKILGGEIGGESPIKSVVQNFLQGKALLLLPKSNLLLLDEEDLAGAILSEFSDIEEVDINKRFDKTLEISIKERKSDFLWCGSNNECFDMTKAGLVFNKTMGLGEGKVIFKGRIEGDPIMKKFATTEEMEVYTKLLSWITKAGLKVFSLNVESEDKVVVETDIGEVFFSGEDKDIQESAESAILLIKDQRSKNPSVRFEYIDARFGAKLFYKVK